MALCCLFNSRKEYAYQVGVYLSGYRVEKVLVKICDKCNSKKVKNIEITDNGFQSCLCGSIEEVYDVSKINGIPLLKDVK
ncbi:MAG: hypothetical protein J6A25_02755 [Lachnospiraceae bacterium]|nr:hypothetical protein [Lachnospiraceae bacterium]